MDKPIAPQGVPQNPVKSMSEAQQGANTRLDKKKYRIRPGHSHWIPNPHVSANVDEVRQASHVEAVAGDVIELNKDQYAAIKHKVWEVGSQDDVQHLAAKAEKPAEAA